MKQRGDRGHAGSAAPRPYTPCVWWRVSVVMLVVLTPALGGGGGHQVLRGRCYSYCMKRHLLQPASPSGEVDPESLPKNPIRACQRHQNCRWCLYVCERPEENFTNSTACLRDCRYTRTRPRSGGRQACTETCGFVGRASSARGGTCPAPLSLNGFQSACVNSCHRDRDCHRAEEKCCSNNCGAVCTQPYDVHILPPVPTNISFKMLKTGGVMIKWRLDGGASERGGSAGDRTRGAVWGDAPVVFILRWWCPYTSGAVTSVTDRSRTKLQGYPTGIYPGSKCHFMVAAVNVYGSRGFSRVSPYIKKFLTPSPPLHLEQVRTRVHNDGQVDVIIQWQPPVYTDGLPIFRYQVFWSDHLPQASPSYMRFHMYRRVLDADKTTFVLQSLRPGTLYFVQVRAVVRWKGRQKRGELASAYIETYSPPQPYVPREDNGGGGGGSGEEGDADNSIIQSVSVNQTFYHDTILKASLSWTLKPDTSARKYLIYWRAETCARSDHRKLHRRLETSATSHDRRFLLYNLQPECEYAVRVHPVNKRGRTGAATVTNFVTPPCHQAEVRQGEPPVCHTAEPPEQVKGLHSETSRCVTVIRWELPSSGGDDVESYDVMWGETTAGAFTTSTIIYTSDPQEMSLPANVSEVELGQLTSGQHYSVQVRARSAGGTGPPAILHLTVPHPDRPCDRHSPQAGARSPDNDNKQHWNHSVTPSESRTDDADDTSYLNGSASRNPTLSSNKTRSSDVTSNRTGDVSIDLDVIDKFGNSEERGDGGDVGVDSGKGVSEEGELGLSSGAPTPSASTKDVTDSASRRDNGMDPGGAHSQHGKDSVGNTSDSGRDSDGVAFRTQSVNTTLPTDLTMDTTVSTAGSVTARSPTNTSGPAVTGAAGTSKASLSLTLFLSCLLLLYVCVRT